MYCNLSLLKIGETRTQGVHSFISINLTRMNVAWLKGDRLFTMRCLMSGTTVTKKKKKKTLNSDASDNHSIEKPVASPQRTSYKDTLPFKSYKIVSLLHPPNVHHILSVEFSAGAKWPTLMFRVQPWAVTLATSLEGVLPTVSGGGGGWEKKKYTALSVVYSRV